MSPDPDPDPHFDQELDPNIFFFKMLFVPLKNTNVGNNQDLDPQLFQTLDPDPHEKMQIRNPWLLIRIFNVADPDSAFRSDTGPSGIQLYISPFYIKAGSLILVYSKTNFVK